MQGIATTSENAVHVKSRVHSGLRSLVLAGVLAAASVSAGLAEAAADSPIDINRADSAMIATTLSGIGPAKAQAIVDYRNENGPFAKVEDLQNVPGIGAATLARIRDLLILESTDQATAPTAKPGE